MFWSRYRPHVVATLSLGLPLIGSHLARMAIGVSDTVMIGWYGVEELAALVIATSFLIILFFLGMGFGTGVMGLIATSIARGDETEVRRGTRMALWLSGIFSLLVMPPMWFAEPILLALGQTPLISEMSQDYLRIAGWGLLPMLAGLTLNSYLAALERTQVVMWVTLAGLPLNVAMNWVFIFGNLGAPELGVRGAAIASLSVQVTQLLMLVGYAAWLPVARKYNLFQRFWRPDWPAFWAIFRLGLPIGVTMLAEGGLFVASNVMMGWIGTKELAAHGIAIQIASITFMAHLGLSNAATVRIGQAKGRGDAAWMRDAGVTVTALSMGFAVLAVALYLIFPDALVRMYLDPADPETPVIVAIGAMLLFYAALFQLTDALQVVALGLLRGVHDTRVPMWIAGFSYWVVGMPIAWGLAFPLGFGAPGLWLGLVAGLSVAAVLLLIRFWRGWRRGDWTAQPPAV
ncbi:MATE family efflux transporter [Paracoccus sp. R12_1]|jgi:MATE family multidrug resistance protein|uniref:Multidrug-efflux transporter n=1 Tax=Paracoccus maritimus TaxID=2933292 RepID=A0ABT2KAX0_9RHOB|nr:MULTISPECIES: MATE family efflux transporter [unclassified Paracoccus (in: a-proteobacteria)]MBO9454814.1 MATE family efflux transporter [Paracoccus sp. R12_2]MBO9485498.1 MATE family efflux transporter [Paracoccus sp. R12_1]MCT4333669.1 MATE family efflux transporter [Paracoccus sp. YLB-12]PHQ70614.1 MAG: MATE family efflux transporter [Paracoccus sp. (in: a-proteobacteria)]